jgi:hypothetical protein
VSTSPSPTMAPQPMAEPACRREPERWFDRADRTHALAACLACPVRSWCAREAVSSKASWGMWAGIWIDDNLADVAHYLWAIAQDTPPTTPPPAPAIHRFEAPQRCVVIPPPAKHSVGATITARSSGHCEIMAPGCRLGLESVASRIRSCHQPPDAAAGYAACGSCQAAVTSMEPRLQRRLGYSVDSPASAATIPFYWRQSHWMRLDPAGGAAPCAPAEQIA